MKFSLARAARNLLPVVAVLASTVYAATPSQDADASLPSIRIQQSASTTEGVLIRWRAREGVRRYRLQLALDNNFNDIVFDRATETNTYRVTELPPGKYYWRVAPATTETESYTTIGVITVAPPTETRPASAEANAAQPATATSTASAPLFAIAKNAGWHAAIGQVVSLDLIPDSNSTTNRSTNILASDSAGTIFAFDLVRGGSLWIARFDPLQKIGGSVDRARIGSFTPLVLDKEGTANRVLVRFADGVRLLDASNGGEVWRASLGGVPTAGARIGASSNGGASLLVTTASPNRIYFIDETTGRITREQNLEAEAIGAPVVFDENSRTQILVAHESSLTIYSNSDQGTPRTLKLDTRLTTPPHVLDARTNARLLFGTERGLVALRLPELLPAWRIATDSDAPRGSLASRDLDADGTAEAVMITRSGRVALVDAARGAIKWVAEGATDACAATFADLDRDGITDVIAAGGDAFANAYSGRDGKVILRDEEEAAPTIRASANSASPVNTGQAGTLRSLAVVNIGGTSGGGANAGSTLLIGADGRGVGLRAVRLSRAALSSKR